jgi:hypothetical protein
LLIENLAEKKFNVFVSAVNGEGKESRLSVPAEGKPLSVAA